MSEFLDLAESVTDAGAALPAFVRLMPASTPPPDEGEIAAACAMIDAADRIIIMGGLGAAAAGRRRGALADSWTASATPSGARPVRPSLQPECGRRIFIGNRAQVFAAADLVIAVGRSLASHNSDAASSAEQSYYR